MQSKAYEGYRKEADLSLPKNIVVGDSMKKYNRAGEFLGPEIDYACYKDNFKSVL